MNYYNRPSDVSGDESQYQKNENALNHSEISSNNGTRGLGAANHSARIQPAHQHHHLKTPHQDQQ